ncbi:Mss4-like protein [Xylariaceae sp. AK1471]|nr:Mss4-like protein [Xylariaceae sp. AK1471]
MTVNEEALELTAQCLCQAHHFTSSVPRSSLPLKATYCHCTSCRHVTGALYSNNVPWHGDSETIRASSLQRYVFSERLTILFCGTCSSTMFFEKRAAEEGEGTDGISYGVLTGVLANVNIPNLVKIMDHIFVGDTLDGGATPWLCHVNSDGTRPRLWKGRKEQSEELMTATWPTVEDCTGKGKAAAAADSEEFPVRCHCGGVDLVLRRPIADFAAKKRSELPWFVDPVTNKALAAFDPCDTCRLSAGVDIFNWTFTLLRHLAFPRLDPNTNTRKQPGFPESSIELKNVISTTTQNRDPRWGTLAFYESSPDVQRYFCSRCSACVFYAADDRPEMVNVAIGLLDSQNGARAEGLLSWAFGGKMVWREDVVGGWREEFVESVEAAAERWRIERGYPKNWRRIQKEEAAMIT